LHLFKMTATNPTFIPPPWVRDPQLWNCGLKLRKEGKLISTIDAISRKGCVTFGRNAQMSDIKLDHPSISRRHAMIGHGSSGNIYLMDFGSSHGTYLNGQKISPNHRKVLKNKDVIKFGASTREYVVFLDLDYKENEDNNNSTDNTNEHNDNNNNNENKTSRKRHLTEITTDDDNKKKDNDNNIKKEDKTMEESPRKKQKSRRAKHSAL